LQISDRADYGCAKFNFAHKFLLNGCLSAPNLAFLDENFPPRRKLSDNSPTAQNLGEGSNWQFPPLCDDATVEKSMCWCTENVKRMTSLVQTAVGRCAVVAATRHVRSTCGTAASANTTGVATSSVRPAPRPFKSTDANECHPDLSCNYSARRLYTALPFYPS